MLFRSQKYDTRPVREAALETAILSALLLCCALTPIVIILSRRGAAAAWRSIVDTGALLYGQLGWTLNLYITVLLAFYAVSIGGQVLGDAKDAARIRWNLGIVAEFMAASTAILAVFVVAYLFTEPSRLASVVVVAPAMLIIAFLAVQLGSFVVLDLDERLKVARSAMDGLQGALQKVKLSSSKPVLLVATSNLVILSALAWLAGAVQLFTLAALRWYGMCFAVTLVLMGSLAVSKYLVQAGIVVHYKWVVWLVPFFLCGATVLVAIGLAAADVDGIGLRAALALTVIVVGSCLSVFYSGLGPRRLALDWTIHGAVSKLAARALEKKYRTASERWRSLVQEDLSQEAGPRLFQRLRDAFRPVVADSVARS